MKTQLKRRLLAKCTAFLLAVALLVGGVLMLCSAGCALVFAGAQGTTDAARERMAEAVLYRYAEQIAQERAWDPELDGYDDMPFTYAVTDESGTMLAGNYQDGDYLARSTYYDWYYEWIDDHTSVERGLYVTLYADTDLSGEGWLPLAVETVTLWHNNRWLLLSLGVASLLLSIVPLVFLHAAVGWREEGDRPTCNALDRIPFDLFTAVYAAIGVLELCLLDATQYELRLYFPPVVLALILANIPLVLVYAMSLATRIKTRTLWRNTVIGGVFFVCYAYQFVYLLVPLFCKAKPHAPTEPHRFAVLVAARNEAAVIGQLLDSIRAQDYPAELVTVCVVADNCTDDTAAVARAHGARVYERQDTRRVGKGYALDFLLARLREDEGAQAFDAYLVLDADNLLDPNYITEMNKALCDGYEVVTGYRYSKNYGDNWISAGYGLWFLRESQQLNRVRARLGLGCVVSGTGFAFTRAVARRLGGWPFHTLTEDTEFTAAQACDGVRVGYCESAVLYDEQPITLAQSWRQRLRWAKGYFQVMHRYGGRLLGRALRGDFACYDIFASILPAFVLSGAALAVNLGDLIARLVTDAAVVPAVAALLQGVGGAYVSLWLLGGVTLCTEWRRIRIPAGRKLGLFLLFPLFMLTYVPIALQALVCRVEWTPVAHTRAVTVEDITRRR